MNAALQAKDYGKLRDTLVALSPLMPGNPTVVYNLACADARLGKTPAALSGLRRLAAMGLVYDPAADDVRLRELKRQKLRLKEEMENLRAQAH